MCKNSSYERRNHESLKITTRNLNWLLLSTDNRLAERSAESLFSLFGTGRLATWARGRDRASLDLPLPHVAPGLEPLKWASYLIAIYIPALDRTSDWMKLKGFDGLRASTRIRSWNRSCSTRQRPFWRSCMRRKPNRRSAYPWVAFSKTFFLLDWTSKTWSMSIQSRNETSAETFGPDQPQPYDAVIVKGHQDFRVLGSDRWWLPKSIWLIN